jgi:hypothetical protein
MEVKDCLVSLRQDLEAMQAAQSRRASKQTRRPESGTVSREAEGELQLKLPSH